MYAFFYRESPERAWKFSHMDSDERVRMFGITFEVEDFKKNNPNGDVMMVDLDAIHSVLKAGRILKPKFNV